jgi:cation:H+ antiporter
MNGLGVSLEFLAALLLIAVTGSVLSRCGDAIATRTGLGGTWVGLILLATVTSLPELITGVSAVVLVESADIAVGTILGSCVFNLAVLVLLDFLLKRESVYARVSRGHLLSAGYGVILIGVVGSNLVFAHSDQAIAFGHVGLSTPLILVICWMAVRAVYRREQNQNNVRSADAAVGHPEGVSNAALYWEFSLAAVVVIAAGLWLPFVGERMAAALGIHETFIGTLFIAFATSAPEMAVAVAAIRIGAPNMAVSNLLGSNLFNILILVPEDLLFSRGPILAAAAPVHALSAVSAMMMTGIAMVALLVRPRPSRFGGASLLLLSIYLINSYLIYMYRE